MNSLYPDPNEYYETLLKNVEEIRKVTDFVPEFAITLGSGLHEFAKNIEIVAEVSYHDLTDFPVSTVPGHAGRFIFGKVNDVNVICMDGRVHYYEGYHMWDVVKPMRLMHLLGANIAFITNACGALNPYYNVGDIVSVCDHISLFVPSPLLGPNIPQLGDRFVDMTNIYDEEINRQAYIICHKKNIPLQIGVYMQDTGPHFESPSETRMYHGMGADIVAMSGTCEAIAARHMGMKVCQFSLVTNMTGGLQSTVSDDEVKVTADKNSRNFNTLITGLLDKYKEMKANNNF